MSFLRPPRAAPDPLLRPRLLSTSALALTLTAGLASPAFATIDNTATVTATPPTGPNVTDTSNTVQVPLNTAGPQLTVTKTFGSLTDVVDIGVYDAGDTLSYTISIKNDGNVTMYNVAPSETANGAGITFNGSAGTGSFGSFVPATATIAPGATQNYTVTYTLSDADAYRAAGLTNAVNNISSATGNIGAPGGAAITGANVTNDNATATIPETPRIEVTKVGTLVETVGVTNDGLAEVGDTIQYVYTAVNTGNTVLTAVSVTDAHETGGSGAATIVPGNSVTTNTSNETLASDGPLGGSSTGTTNDGVWASMSAGATVTFAYDHTVTQAEFNDQ